jgi:hypothetical protein
MALPNPSGKISRRSLKQALEADLDLEKILAGQNDTS